MSARAGVPAPWRAVLRACLPAVGLGTLLLGGCGVVPPQVAPPPAPAAVPDLRGTWTGTWGGTAVTLVLIEQVELGAYSGLSLGPVQLLGRRVPSVSGVMTSTIRGEAVSVNVQGWLGTLAGTLALVVTASPPAGSQQLTFTRVEPDRLVGAGESDFAWGPHGPVEVLRRSR